MVDIANDDKEDDSSNPDIERLPTIKLNKQKAAFVEEQIINSEEAEEAGEAMEVEEYSSDKE